MFQPDAVATANVSRMRRFVSLAFEGGVSDACDELIHPDCEVTDPNIPDGGWRGPALAKAVVRAVHAHFDRYTLRLDDAFAVGENHVVNRFTGHAIHRGGFLGSRAAGREVNWTGNTIYEFEAGLIRRIWIQWDMLAILIQLDVVPPPRALHAPRLGGARQARNALSRRGPALRAAAQHRQGRRS